MEFFVLVCILFHDTTLPVVAQRRASSEFRTVLKVELVVLFEFCFGIWLLDWEGPPKREVFRRNGRNSSQAHPPQPLEYK